jgi:hypothetical protein
MGKRFFARRGAAAASRGALEGHSSVTRVVADYKTICICIRSSKADTHTRAATILPRQFLGIPMGDNMKSAAKADGGGEPASRISKPVNGFATAATCQTKETNNGNELDR